MFRGCSDINVAEIIEFCLWCFHKADLWPKIGTFARVPEVAKVVLNFYTYAQYKSLRPESEIWFISKPLSFQMAKNEEIRPWITLLPHINHHNAADTRD